jgi:small conductance mechanosensitive channel
MSLTSLLGPYGLFLFDPTRWGDWKNWLGEHGSRIAVIVILLLTLHFVFRRIISRSLLSAIARAARVRKEDPALVRRRADTLSATLNWVFGIFLMFLGSGLLLAEIGLNVSALVAGVGVVGIALGLGAQTLVKDVLNGMFILIEDQYAVGDFVTVAGATGQVIEINPRRTVVRDAEGNVHSIPNSAISVAVNKTPSLNRFRVDIEVAFRDGDRASAVADEVCDEVAKQFGAVVLGRPRVVAQTVVGSGDVRLQISGDAQASERWAVESELRRRLKRRFDAERIETRFESDGG